MTHERPEGCCRAPPRRIHCRRSRPHEEVRSTIRITFDEKTSFGHASPSPSPSPEGQGSTALTKSRCSWRLTQLSR